MITRTTNFIFIALLIGMSQFGSSYAQPVKVMPLGNSITYDERIVETRPVGDRIAYRFKLYGLLKDKGYDFDFVGSEDSGNNFFQNSDYDDNAGFPGINAAQMNNLLQTGYNARTSVQVTPGPYLTYYSADIILLHIGTNDLVTDSPDDVEDILNTIRFYDSDVIILIARIINRKTYHALTTSFNDNVEAMVNARGDNRIIVVDMETGAGIDYPTDMYDNLHPKQSGYDKIGQKWFEALENLNNAPVIDDIPEQNTTEGNSFPALNLDNYVTDIEDPDYMLDWTYEMEPGTHLSASIDENRILHVSPLEAEWYGTETIKVKVVDSGNGAFKKADSANVIFNVNRANQLPEITTEPDTVVTVNSGYMYEIMATDPDLTDVVTYDYDVKPAWLLFYAGSDKGVLYGTPQLSDLGKHNVTLKVNDGHADVYQQFTINVKNATGTAEQPGHVLPALSPNPVTDKTYLSLDEPTDVMIYLYSANGILVRTVHAADRSVIEIDLADLPAGLYIYKISTDNMISTGKIIKN